MFFALSHILRIGRESHHQKRPVFHQGISTWSDIIIARTIYFLLFFFVPTSCTRSCKRAPTFHCQCYDIRRRRRDFSPMRVTGSSFCKSLCHTCIYIYIFMYIPTLYLLCTPRSRFNLCSCTFLPSTGF